MVLIRQPGGGHIGGGHVGGDIDVDDGDSGGSQVPMLSTIDATTTDVEGCSG